MTITQRNLNTVGLKTFFNIMDAWSQPEDAQVNLLGITHYEKFSHLKKQEASDINEDTLIRISLIINIYSSLHTIFNNNKQQADSWVNRTNKKYEGMTAMEYMLKNKENGIENVCRYLQSEVNS